MNIQLATPNKEDLAGIRKVVRILDDIGKGYMPSTENNTSLEIANIENYDLVGAVQEKLAFNANREDHKRENRSKENGKAY